MDGLKAVPFKKAGKPDVFEGYDLQVVRKGLQTGTALAAEGTALHLQTTFPAT
jgi:hypothetical protein